MRNLFFLIGIFICLSFQAVKKSKKDNVDSIDSIVAYSTFWGFEPPVAISCETFISRSSNVKFNLTSYKKRLVHILSLKEKFTGSSDWYIDTRGQIIIYYSSKKIDTVCTGTLPVISINGMPFDMPNRGLEHILDSLYNDKVYYHH